MNGKRFTCLVLGAILLLFSVLTAFVGIVDPFFQFRVPETAVFQNERYENAGIIRNTQFDTVIMGTSLVCNFRASWFDELTGGQTLKIGIRDGYLSEFHTSLQLAFETVPEIRTVYFGLDPGILVRSDSERTTELPDYLYDSNPLNDVSYFLNLDVYLYCFHTLLERARGSTVPLDEAYIWSRDAVFSTWQTLAGYERPEHSDTRLARDAFVPAAEENLAVISAWVTEHPETEFHIFFSPYSILYWDRMTRTGRLDAVLGALEDVIPKLMEYENVTLHFFLDWEEVITDFDNYTDNVHFSPEIDYRVTEGLLSGAFVLTPETWQQRLNGLEELVRGYDFDALLAPYGK